MFYKFMTVFMITLFVAFTIIMIGSLIIDHRKLKNKKRTNYDAIREMDKMQMSRWLISMEVSVPRYENCDQVFCSRCDRGYECYIKWLDQEAKINE